jgi:hypothetical protein
LDGPLLDLLLVLRGPDHIDEPVGEQDEARGVEEADVDPV